MSEQRTSDVLGALPHRRPQRRSDKRASTAPTAGNSDATAPVAAAPASAGSANRRHGQGPRLRQPAQPAGTPAGPRAPRRALAPTGTELVGTAVQAAAELAEMGLSISARAIRRAVPRLPRP